MPERTLARGRRGPDGRSIWLEGTEAIAARRRRGGGRGREHRRAQGGPERRRAELRRAPAAAAPPAPADAGDDGARDAATRARRAPCCACRTSTGPQFYTEGLGFSVLRAPLLPARATFTAVLGGGGAAAGAPSRAHGTTLELVQTAARRSTRARASVRESPRALAPRSRPPSLAPSLGPFCKRDTPATAAQARSRSSSTTSHAAERSPSFTARRPTTTVSSRTPTATRSVCARPRRGRGSSPRGGTGRRRGARARDPQATLSMVAPISAVSEVTS